VTLATGVGSMPGEDDAAYVEAVRTVFGELPDLPHLPELPARGAAAGMTGRGLAIVSELGADLQPAGWRLTDAPGVDQRRARSLLAQDLDRVEEQAQGYDGAFKVQVAGPWTMAATIEKPRGDKLLSDIGARRELAQALAEGLGDHVGDLRRRMSGVDRLVVQVDEPALAAVLAGSVPTASGFHRHRSVEPQEASTALGWVFDAITRAGAEPWAHSCASGTPLRLLRGAGARGLSIDLGLQSAADHDALAEALEGDDTVVLGVVPSVDPATALEDGQVAEQVMRWLDVLGLEPSGLGDRLALSPTCGLAGASAQWARRALTLVRTAAGQLSG